jgi:hypothetical protein
MVVETDDDGGADKPLDIQEELGDAEQGEGNGRGRMRGGSG